MNWVMLLAGIGIGFGLGVFYGQILMRLAMSLMEDTISKVSFSLRYPSPQVQPVQTEAPTEHTFDDSTADNERVPDWMDDAYPLGVSDERTA